MSTRTIRCSNCGQAGHNCRTCDRRRKQADTKLRVAILKKEIHGSKFLPIKCQPKKHNCTICMCDIETEKDSMCLPCGHHFHVTCGLKWLQENNTCPCCRAECGEKPKKLPVLNTDVASALTSELLSSNNMVLDISQRNQTVCEQPWNYPGYSHYLNHCSHPNHRDFTEEELKEHWNNESQATKIRLKCRFLYQNNAQSLATFMLNGFANARAYQEGDFDLSAVLVNQPESGLVVQLPFAPTQAEEHQQDTESDIGDYNHHIVSDDEGNVTDVDYTEQDIEDELDAIALEHIATDSDDYPMTMDELDTPLTAQTILDYHRPDITADEALDIINTLSSPPTTPEPTPIQVPNAPRRRRSNRSTVQSPPPSPTTVAVTAGGLHVTRRSSDRLRQRYRRRRLQEEIRTMSV